MTPRYLASIIDGKFIYQDENSLKQRIRKFEGKEVYITITRKSKVRSISQNSYYWGVVIPILAKELGEFDEDMDLTLRNHFQELFNTKIHDALKIKFLTDRLGKLPIIRSTTDLSTVEFEEFLSKVRVWASKELNIYIPEPNEI
jgi:hypothetical protein